jgi:hypothetical protein
MLNDTYTLESSPNALNGILSGSAPPTLVPSAFSGFSNAIQFSGVDAGSTMLNQSIICPSNPFSLFTPQAFTLEAKILKTRTATEVIAAVSSDVLTIVNMFLSGDKLNATVWDSSGSPFTATGATTLTNANHSLAADFDGSTLRVYVDGILDGSASVSGIYVSPPAIQVPFTMGRSSQSSSNGFPFAGNIGEVRLSSVARYAGTNYTPATSPFVYDSSTVALWHLSSVVNESSSFSLGTSSSTVGSSTYFNVALDGTLVQVKSTVTNLYGYHIYNPGTAMAYIQLFNAMSADVTLGTTAPAIVLAIPPEGGLDMAQGSVPVTFSRAMTLAATTTPTGATGVSTGVLINLFYI